MAGLVLAAVAAGVLMGGSTTPPPAPGAPVSERATTIPETLVVHVSGMVLAPGVVHVPAGSIVADVVEAAGGLMVGASIETLNLAATVTSGEHVVVPGIDDDSASMTATDSGDGSGGPLSLNTATATQLESLPGVGPVLAERIVAFREQNGPFGVVEDLLEVSGIGEAKLAALRDLVVP